MPAERGRLLTVVALLLVLLAASDFLKPLRLEGTDTGLVVLGVRRSGTANAVGGMVLGLFLLTYAAGILGMRRWVVPLAWAYAAYVTVNVALFPFRTPIPADAGVGYWTFGVVYTIVAIGASFGIARALSRRRPDLR
jgi:hypothetical protein